MEEIFKGLIERAQYYEQFESYRNRNLSVHFEEMPALKIKASAMSMWYKIYLRQPESDLICIISCKLTSCKLKNCELKSVN